MSSCLLPLLLGLAGCTTVAFACDDNEQCQSADGQGECEFNGYCSFPDQECPSGRRFGDAAGGGLAGKCVNLIESTTDAASSGGAVSSSDATTLSTSTTADGTTTSASTTGESTTDSPSTSMSPSEPTTSSSTTAASAGTESESTGGTECDAEALCVPAPPAGWEGPFVALSYAATKPVAPACPADDNPLELGIGFEVGDGSNCACSCTPSPGVCSGSVALYGTAGCGGPGLQALLSSGDCINPSSSGSFRFSSGSNPSGSTCLGTVEAELSAVETSLQVRLCAEAGGSCDAGSGVCTAAPTQEAPICITRPEELECPASYPVPLPTGAGVGAGRAFAELEDARGCPPCSCQVAIETCSGGGRTFGDADCQGVAVSVGTECEAAQSVGGVSLRPPVVTCGVPDAPAVTGAVSPVDAVTICCAR